MKTSEIGQDIYLPGAIYISRGEDDYEGGKARVVDIRSDLESVLSATGCIAPVRSPDGEIINDTPAMPHFALVNLVRALAKFKPETELELAYWSSLHDFCQNGGLSETPETYHSIRRLERDLYLTLGYDPVRLAKFYSDLG